MTENPVGGGADQIAVPTGDELAERIVTCTWALTLSAVAVSVTCPAARAVTTPVPFPFVVTVARLELLTLQVASVRGMPLLSIAVISCVPPIIMFTTAGVICNVNGGGSVVVES